MFYYALFRATLTLQPSLIYSSTQKEGETEQKQKEFETQEKVRISYLVWFCQIKVWIVLLKINIPGKDQRGKTTKKRRKEKEKEEKVERKRIKVEVVRRESVRTKSMRTKRMNLRNPPRHLHWSEDRVSETSGHNQWLLTRGTFPSTQELEE